MALLSYAGVGLWTVQVGGHDREVKPGQILTMLGTDDIFRCGYGHLCLHGNGPKVR